MKNSALLFIVLFLAACQTQVNFEPRKVNFERDVCKVCKMGLTDPKFSIQAINQYGEVRWYDDLGCLAEDMRESDFNAWKGDKYKIWIGNMNTGKWMDAEKAYYQYGVTTPMGYGYAAVSLQPGDSLYDFHTALKRIDEGKTMRADFIRKKKISISGNDDKPAMKCQPGKCGGQ